MDPNGYPTISVVEAKRSLMLLMVSGFSTLGYLAARTYRDAPPIPARVLDPAGATVFTGQDIMAG